MQITYVQACCAKQQNLVFRQKEHAGLSAYHTVMISSNFLSVLLCFAKSKLAAFYKDFSMCLNGRSTCSSTKCFFPPCGHISTAVSANQKMFHSSKWYDKKP